jgi:ethanolamine ammonia-lyase small subunit
LAGSIVTAPVTADPWAALRRHTPVRIALGRSGVALKDDSATELLLP